MERYKAHRSHVSGSKRFSRSLGIRQLDDLLADQVRRLEEKLKIKGRGDTKMIIKVEVKETDKITTYSADTSKTVEVIDQAVKGVENFLKATFKKEVYTKTPPPATPPSNT